MDLVRITASIAGLGHVPGYLELAHDLRRGPFSDADAFGDVSQAKGGVGGDAGEDVRVVGHEPPRMVKISGT